MSDYINDLLQKYISGKICSEEFVELLEHINLNPDKDLIPLLQQQWENQKPESPFYKEDIQEIFAGIRTNTMPIKTVERIRIGWFQMAAVVVFFLLSGLSLYFYICKQEYVRLGERDIVVSAGKGERASVVLPDGTNVRLNSESVLSYRQDFGRNGRHVSLVGEGYFEVAKDASMQFFVHTQHLDVKVLGTTFNLCAYEKDKTIELVLVSGSVEVSTNYEPSQIARLHPNEKALFYTQTKQLIVEKTTNRYETAWVEGELVFRSEPLKEVVRQVGRKYGVTIELNIPSVEQDRYSGVFDKEDIYEALDILKAHYGFEYRIDNDTAYVIQSDR